MLFPLHLDPNIQKNDLLNELISQREVVVQDSRNNEYISNTYFIKETRLDIFKKRVESFRTTIWDEDRISSAVLTNTWSVLDRLSLKSLDRLNIDDIMVSSYGTIIIDWEKDRENVFSLEIGKDSLGYFIEENGRDTKQVDQDSTDSVQLLSDLKNFLERHTF